MLQKACLFLASIWLGNLQASEPELWFFFDVNKTIIMSDAASGKSEADVIAGMFAEAPQYAFFGKNGQQTYYDAITSQLQDTWLSGEELKHRRNVELQSTVEKIKSKLQAEEITALEERIVKIQKTLSNTAQHHGLIPSFQNFLRTLSSQEKYRYKIIFRTFGDDLATIKEGVKSLFPSQDIRFIDGQFQGNQFFCAGQTYSHKKFHHALKTDPEDIFFTFRDDYAAWKETNFFPTGGKPFPVFCNEKRISIFFDDNIDIGIIFPYDGITGSPQVKLSNLEFGLRTVSPLQAIEDKDYYVRVLEEIPAHFFTPIVD